MLVWRGRIDREGSEHEGRHIHTSTKPRREKKKKKKKKEEEWMRPPL